MEDWVDAIKMRLHREQHNLPPEDWERFKADYHERKKKRQILPWGLALAAAAGIAIVLLVNKPASNAVVAPLVESELPKVVPDARIVSDGQEAQVVAPSRPIIGISKELAVCEEIPADPEPVYLENLAEKRDTMSQTQETPEQIVLERGVFEDAFTDKPISNHFALAPYIRGSRGGISSRESSSLPGYGYFPDGTTPTIESQTHHSIPFSFGLDASLSLGSRLQLTSGVELSVYLSDFTIVNDLNTKDYAQKAYYLGVPLRLEWTVWQQDRISSWIGAGGKVDYLVYGKLGNVRLKDNTFHYSVVGDIGLEYKLFPWVGLFLQPEVSYYFKPSDPAVLTYRTEHPLNLSIGTGFRFVF